MNQVGWDKRIVVAVVALVVLYGLGWIPMPWESQVRALIETLIPWAPLFVILFFVGQVALQGVINGITSFFKSIWKTILGLLWVMSFAAFFFPLAIADTFMFGQLSHWLWINQNGTMILVALTAFAFYLMGGITAIFWRRYFGFMVLWGIFILVVSVLEYYFMDSHKVVFRVLNNKVYAVPTQTVHIEKTGEPTFIHVSAFGRVKAGDKFYPPMGDAMDTIPDPLGGWYAPRGQIRLVIHPSRNAPAITIPVKHKQEGIQKFAGIDTGESIGGYYLSGVAEIPAGISGWLMLDFESITPESGFVRITFRIAPDRSIPGKLLALEWYSAFLLIVLGSVLWWSIPPLAGYFLSATTPGGGIAIGLGWLKVVWFILYAVTLAAILFSVTPLGEKAYKWIEGFDGFKSWVRPSVSFSIEKSVEVKPLCTGNETYVVVNPKDPHVVQDALDKGCASVKVTHDPRFGGLLVTTIQRPMCVFEYWVSDVNNDAVLMGDGIPYKVRDYLPPKRLPPMPGVREIKLRSSSRLDIKFWCYENRDKVIAPIPTSSIPKKPASSRWTAYG